MYLALSRRGTNRSGTASPAQLFPEGLWCPLRRDGDDDLRETSHVRAEKAFGPPRVSFPAFSKPRPHRPLHPELAVVQESFQELERLVQLAGEHEVVWAADRDAAAPRLRGFRRRTKRAKARRR